jgi:plastocyanin
MKYLQKALAISGLGLLLFMQTTASAARIDVAIQNFAFSPAKSRIAVGDTVRWTNNDTAPHTSTSDSGIWNSGNLSHGQTYSHVFTSPGTFPYHCAVHTSMKDTIFVGTTAIDDQSSLPESFNLLQNYPNPFNARTLISFDLPKSGATKLEIFDILGRHIETLFDGELEQGPHSFSWDAGNQSSGIFFYQLTSGAETKTARMTLLK